MGGWSWRFVSPAKIDIGSLRRISTNFGAYSPAKITIGSYCAIRVYVCGAWSVAIGNSATP